MENHQEIQLPDLGSAPKKTYNSPRMEAQGNANQIVRSGAATHDIEANWAYCISSAG